jgi:hypothetical protein
VGAAAMVRGTRTIAKQRGGQAGGGLFAGRLAVQYPGLRGMINFTRSRQVMRTGHGGYERMRISCSGARPSLCLSPPPAISPRSRR